MKNLCFFALVCLLVTLSMCESVYVPKRDKVLCLVLTKSEHKKEAFSVRDTWGRQCDNLVFVSDSTDESLPTEIQVNKEMDLEAYMKAYEHVYSKYKDSVSWILTIQSDSFVEMENVRNLVSSPTKNKPYFIGTQGLENPSSFFVSKFGTIMNIEALEILMKECANKENNNADEEIFNTSTVKINYCLTEFYNDGFPESVQEILKANKRTMKPTCENNFVAISGVAFNQNQLIEEAISKAKFDKLVNDITKNALDSKKPNARKFENDNKLKVQRACASIKQNAENLTKSELEKQWDSGMEEFCGSVMQ